MEGRKSFKIGFSKKKKIKIRFFKIFVQFSIVMPIRENFQVKIKEFLNTEKILKEDKIRNALELLRAGFSELRKDGGNTFHTLFSAFNCFLLMKKREFSKKCSFAKTLMII